MKRNETIKHETIISSIAEPYFIEDSISPFTVTLTGDNPDQNGGLSYLKNNTNDLNIKLVHDYYKNEFDINLPTDTNIIFGAGTTMMVAALYYALQKKLNRSITVNTNTDIFYVLHKKLALPLKNVEWTNHTNTNTNTNNLDTDLTVIVSPNNPLGIITDPTNVRTKYMLYDVVYDKPLFTGQFKTINEKLYQEFNINSNVFITTSFSKLGIPGVRFGFLITRDKQIAEYCEEFVNTMSVRYPTASATIGRLAYYKYFSNHNWQMNNHHILRKRASDFIKYAKKHDIVIYNKTEYVPFVYTNKSVNWWMTHFNVETRKGSYFNDTDDNSRFNLMLSDEYWDEFMRRFI